jgi:sugar O-acyltransferase (sialic acid O-acetyltransferase NeuD family)
MINIILVGKSIDIIELCESVSCSIIGIVDNELVGSYYNHPILGSDDDLDLIISRFGDAEVFVSPDNPKVRKKIVDLITVPVKYASLYSMTSCISKYVLAIGSGVLIHDGVKVMQNAVIGNYVRVNRSAHVAHDTHIGDFVTIAPNAVILGRVSIGNYCYIGANATILPEVTICDNAIIGAGAVVTKDILEAGTYVGMPAKRIK